MEVPGYRMIFRWLAGLFRHRTQAPTPSRAVHDLVTEIWVRSIVPSFSRATPLFDPTRHQPRIAVTTNGTILVLLDDEVVLDGLQVHDVDAMSDLIFDAIWDVLEDLYVTEAS